MKRSKIFLGMTTGILAVAALVAAKASKFTTPVNSYYSVTAGHCTVLSPRSYYTRPDAGTQAKWGTHDLFTYNSGNSCATPVYLTHFD